MDLFDLAADQPIETAPFPSGPDGLLRYLRARTPVVLTGVREALPFTRDWNLDWLRDHLATVRVQRAEPDGHFHYLSFRRMPMGDFVEALQRGEGVYAQEKLLGQGVHRDLPEAAQAQLPEYVPAEGFRDSNLYIGAGGNTSLLHYDETHSLLAMLQGRKRVLLFPPDQSGRLYPYSTFNLRALLQGRVIDSRIDCSWPDLERFPRLAEARGVTGWLEEDQALLIPAGTWHYIMAEGVNVALNYFWFQNRLQDWLRPPLRQFWAKRRILDAVDLARPVKHMIQRSLSGT